MRYLRVDARFPVGSIGKEFACNAGDPGSVPELGHSVALAPANLSDLIQTLSLPVSLHTSHPDLLFFFGCAMWYVGSYFPDQGLNPCPLHLKGRVLTTGPPGKSLTLSFSFFLDCTAISPATGPLYSHQPSPSSLSFFPSPPWQSLFDSLKLSR